MRKNIIIMNLLVAFFWMTMYSYSPNLPEYARSLGADAVVLGVIGGAYGIAQIILRIPIGVTSDNTGKNKLMLVIGSCVLAISCGIFILAQDTNMLILGRVIAGAAAAWWVILSATYADYHTDEKQIRAQGILSASSSGGKVAAAAIGGILAQFLGMHSVFVFAFILAVVCIVLSTQLKDLPKKPQKKSFRDLLSLLRNRDLMVLSIIGIISQILCFAAPTLFTAVAAEDLGASSLQIGMLNMVFFLATGISSLFVGGRVYKKIGGIKAMSFSFILCALSLIPAFYHMNIAAIYLMQVVSGFGYGITGSAVAGMVIRSVAPDQRGAANGIFQSMYGIGVLIGPMLAGSIIKWGSFDAAYWALAALGFASAIIFYLLIPKKYARM